MEFAANHEGRRVLWTHACCGGARLWEFTSCNIRYARNPLGTRNISMRLLPSAGCYTCIWLVAMTLLNARGTLIVKASSLLDLIRGGHFAFRREAASLEVADGV